MEAARSHPVLPTTLVKPAALPALPMTACISPAHHATACIIPAHPVTACISPAHLVTAYTSPVPRMTACISPVPRMTAYIRPARRMTTSRSCRRAACISSPGTGTRWKTTMMTIWSSDLVLIRGRVLTCGALQCASRKIRLIESDAKCCYLKKMTCKGTLRQVFYLSGPPPLL